jgi:Protein of unknown function (DUF2505)
MRANGNLRRMATSLEHRSNFTATACVLYETLVDKAFLTARLRDIGGKNAALLEHTRDGDTTTFRMRQGVDAAQLPGAIRKILNGDLVVQRMERWRPEDGRFAGASTVRIDGVPGDIAARSRVAGEDTRAHLVISAQVKVSIPLIGGKLETVVAEQVGKLLAAEAEYIEKWLGDRG